MLQETTSDVSVSLLANLTHRRWCIPILAAFANHGNAKFVTLAHRLGCGRGALSASLNHLIGLGLITRNAGLGHPLRPEYLLSARGQRIAAPLTQLHHQIERWGGQGLAYRKWSLPLVVAIGPTRQRFNDLKTALNPISPRALAMGLQQLEHDAWISRVVTPHYPPVTQYSLQAKGEQLFNTLST